MTATEFDLDGTRFEVNSLGLDEACMGAELFGRVAGPGIAAWLDGRNTGNVGGVVQAALSNASQLPKLVRMFAKQAKFDRLKDGRMVPLEPFVNDVFAGKLEFVVAFLLPCVRAEFGSFLVGDGLESLLKQVGFASPPAPTD